jgi:hypothetical protein
MSEADNVQHPTRWWELGPHPLEAGRGRALIDVFLPWPVRVLVVLVAGLLGWHWAGTPLGEQLGGGLQYAGLIGISLAVSFWWWIFLANVVLAGLWLVWPLGRADERPWRSAVEHVLTFANRQVGHIEVLSVWLALSLVSADRLPVQLLLATAAILLTEPLLTGLARWLLCRGSDPETVARDLGWKRRPLFYLFTLLGLVIIALQAPGQWAKLLPGVLALAVADGLRYLRHRRFMRALRSPERLDYLHGHHARQRRWGRRADLWLGPGLVLGLLVLVVVASAWARSRYDRSIAASRPVRGEPVDYCASIQPPAPAADIAMFIVADSQFHELHGAPFVGQMAFADALVPVALRPVELDLLSAAPLSRAATIYAALAAQRPGGARLWWSHLGDMADLSCADEMDRTNELLLDRFPPQTFAGVAPGNHDKAFAGNFFWSPYWDSACPSGRMEKPLSDHKLQSTWRARVEDAGGRMLAVSGGSPVAAATRRGHALVTATPLGVTSRDERRRGVIGVFLDTSDGLAFDFGVAGLFGTFSSAQGETARTAIAAVRASAGPDYGDPLYVLFLHSPLGETIRWSRQRLTAWVQALDGDDARVLGIVSAHTHEVQKHSHCVGHRMIPEVVVGSTLDPPQEAALLTIGPQADGTLGLRVQTLPLVARPGKTCGARAPSLSTADCQQTMAELRGHPACAALFRQGEANALGRDCSDIEHPLAIEDRLQQAARWFGPGDEQEIKADQRRRAAKLWGCICRDGSCAPGQEMLDLRDNSYFRLAREVLARSPEREQELACLAWAGAAVQRYKTAGMSYGDALRCAFDDENLAPARDYIARLEVMPCY